MILRVRPSASPVLPAPSGWLDTGITAPAGVICPSPDFTGTSTTISPRIGLLAPPAVYDGGRLRIDPPPAGADPAVLRATAYQDLLTTAELRGAHQCTGFGLASVTLQPGGDGVPARHRRLTWVGISHPAPLGCPMQGAGRPLYWGASPVTVALIDATTPNQVAVYTSRGVVCGEPPQGPTLAPAHQLLSVAFEQDGAGQVAYELPPCGVEVGGGSLFDGHGGGTAEVDVTVPFDPPPGCAGQQPRRTVTVLSVPPGAEHAPVGPRAALQ